MFAFVSLKMIAKIIIFSMLRENGVFFSTCRSWASPIPETGQCSGTSVPTIIFIMRLDEVILCTAVSRSPAVGVVAFAAFAEDSYKLFRINNLPKLFAAQDGHARGT